VQQPQSGPRQAAEQFPEQRCPRGRHELIVPIWICRVEVTQVDAASDARVAVALYGVVGVLMTVPWVFLWRRLVRRPELFEPPYDADFARAEGGRSWVGIVVYAACIGVGLLLPVAALALYLAVAVFYAVTSQGWSSARAATPVD